MREAQSICAGLALAAVLLLSAALPAVSVPPVQGVTALTPHAAISITGNADFTAANGVVGGLGTASNPYIIAGWSIDAPPSMGVQIRSTSAHAVVRDVVVTGAPTAGFYTFDVSNLTFSSVSSLGSAGDGIRVESSHAVDVDYSNMTANNNGVTILDGVQVNLASNNVTLNRANGIVVSSSTQVLVQGNAIAYGGQFGGYGLDLASSTNITVIGNRFTGDDIYLEGTVPDHFTTHTIMPDNTVSGLPILYVSNQTGYSISGLQLGELILAGCVLCKIDSMTVGGGDLGVEVAQSAWVTFSLVTIADASLGLLTASSTNVTFSDGAILDTGIGALVQSSTWVDVLSNKISAPFSTAESGPGVAVVSSDNVRLLSNTIRHHVTGIFLAASSNVTTNLNVISEDARGLWFQDSRDLMAWGNVLVQDATGAEVDRVTNGTFGANEFLGLPIGANASDSSQLKFYANAFVQTALSAHDTNGTVDAWDDGYPTGGNFWPNYTGVDHCSGPLQNNCTAADGFGDTPYKFAVNATDHYPLMAAGVGDAPPEALFYMIPAAGSVITTFQVSANLSSDYEDALSALQVRWDWQGNGLWTPWTTEKFASHRYAEPGTYSLRLEVRDLANLTDTWTTSVFVVPKPDNLPPSIRVSAPVSATINEPLVILANITDASGVMNATLLYRGVDGGPFLPVSMFIELGGTNFSATIPAQPHAGTVEYVVVANDTWENQARAPLSGYLSVSVVDPLATFARTILVPLLIVAAGVIIGIVFLRYRRKKPAQKPENGPPPPVPPPGPPGTP